MTTAATAIEPWEAWEAMALAAELGRTAEALDFARMLRAWVESGENVSLLDLLPDHARPHPMAYAAARKRLAELAAVLAKGVAA